MPSGIKTKELVVGTGAVAERGKIVIAHIRTFLNRGEERYSTYNEGKPARIDLSKRKCIAGLRKGIEGMREGGRRELIVSPHLAYGEKGVPDLIPPNAVIRLEVDLLEVCEGSVVNADNCGLRKSLLVFHPGEAARNLPRWQFGLSEGGSAGATITYPLPRLTWRHARERHVKMEFAPTDIEQVIHNAQAVLAEFPKNCLHQDDLWADTSEKANSITRDRRTNSLCVSVILSERGVVLWNYSLPETSPILTGSKFYQIISRALSPYLSAE